MKYGLVFLLLGAVCGAAVFTLPSWWQKLLVGSLALCFGGVGLAFLRLGPRVFCKRPDGRLSLLSYLLFWPYHLLNGMALRAVALIGSERPADEIIPGLWLGRRPAGRERAGNARPRAVLDLTAEFARAGAREGAPHYLCIPLLDTSAPRPGELEEGVRFIRKHLEDGPVLVHCALGHGRSAAFIAAYLLAARQAPDPEAAEAFLRARRPGISLNREQRAALEAFAREHGTLA